MLSPVNRPTLIPGLPRTWRSSSQIQLGSGPPRGVVLTMADPRAAQVLDLLDGSRSEESVLLQAARQGIGTLDARAIIDSLRTAGLAMPAASLVPLTFPGRDRLLSEASALALRGFPAPATILRRRAGCRVVITGRGRLGAAVAVALAEAGIGHVQPDLVGSVTRGELPAGPLREADVGQARRVAVAEAVSRAVPQTQTHPVRRGSATLVVQLDHDEPVALLAAAHAQRRQAHLAVTIREGVPVIGPLVPPAGGPCLSCLDLHRRDRDAGWPGVSRPDALEPCAVPTLLAATAYATAEALTFLDGGSPETLGAATEISGPGRVRKRSWSPHPRCTCTRRPGL
ncbi:hypothetical protein HH310_04800 [Actinoplanes sp. TBRC 11911]|uniref:hypothetical protein n=1 Tax=Actinoplanes sp. TBRC 11911 TaxID=2729386 RepID=UPI00145D06F9|nr:hypothetical protein [Actinoplanes sp. TBRC 11911]NMO50512.1 hypothetical protein [Actinoplanes sp. TBRC 11911]